jgi:hypothetical protein
MERSVELLLMCHVYSTTNRQQGSVFEDFFLENDCKFPPLIFRIVLKYYVTRRNWHDVHCPCYHTRCQEGAVQQLKGVR